MGRTRRPGRLQKIAYDPTPLNSNKPNIDSRIGWLLAMSRLHHPDSSFGDGRQFVTALADNGFTASRSLISRWESGEIPISYEGMSAYEKTLGLEMGQISSLTGYVRAAIPGVKAKVIRPQLDPASRVFAQRLDELIDGAESGEACARDWQDLGWHMAAAPLVHLRRSTWETIANKVVTTLPRCVKVPYRQYSTAAMNIASMPRAQEYLTSAIADYISAPGVQVLTNPIGLLDRLPTREAARLVLDLVDEPPTQTVFRLAVWVASEKIAAGGFTSEERTRLDMTVLRLWRANPAKASEDLAELIACLPEGLRSTLTTAATKAGRRKLGYSVEHAEDLDASAARALSSEIADGARRNVPQSPAYDEDRMLARLIREALFHRDSERRHLAALLVSASPFGDAVCDELLTMLSRPDDSALVRIRTATLARYLSSDVHRMRMIALLEDPLDDVGLVIAQGIGHMTYTEFSDQVMRASLRDEWTLRERAKMYALGMTGSPGLEAIVKARDTPEWQKTAANWWISQGPAIRS